VVDAYLVKRFEKRRGGDNMANTDLTFTGNSDDAVAALAKLERKYEAVEAKLKGIKTGKQSGNTDEWNAGLDTMLSKVIGIGIAYQAMGSAARAVFEENAKIIDQLNNFVPKKSEAEVKLQIQANMSKPEVRAMLPGLEKSLTATPSTDMIGGMKIQQQLASSGIKEEDVKSGEAAKTVLDMKAATNQFGEGIGDEGEATKTIAMLLKGSGKQHPGAADMKEISQSIVSLFEASDVQMQDFKQLAPKMAGLKSAGVKTNESLAAFSALTDVMGGNKADTGLSGLVSRSETIGAFPERAKELESLGLTPEDVSTSKHGFIPVMEKWKGVLSKLPENERNQKIAKIWGEDAAPAANFMFSDSGMATTKDYIRRANDKTPYDRNVQTFQQSRYAGQQRVKIKDEFATDKIDENTGNFTWKEKEDEDNVRYKKKLGQTKSPTTKLIYTAGKAVEGMVDSYAQSWGLSPQDIGLGRDKEITEDVNKPVYPEEKPPIELKGGQAPKGMKATPISIRDGEININDATNTSEDRERDGTVIPRTRPIELKGKSTRTQRESSPEVTDRTFAGDHTEAEKRFLNHNPFNAPVPVNNGMEDRAEEWQREHPKEAAQAKIDQANGVNPFAPKAGEKPVTPPLDLTRKQPATKAEAAYIQQRGGDPTNQKQVDEVRKKVKPEEIERKTGIKPDAGKPDTASNDRLTKATEQNTAALIENNRLAAEANKRNAGPAQPPPQPEVARRPRRPLNRNGNVEQA